VHKERFVWRLGFERGFDARMRRVHYNGVPSSLMSTKQRLETKVFSSVLASLT